MPSGSHVGRIRFYCLVMMVSWTLVIACSFAWFFTLHSRDIREIARAEALAAFERDLLFRRWASRHGGVYVPVSDHTPPNPYLSHVPERDIITPSGRSLTLVNPAYMLRQMYEMAAEKELLGRGHITSLNPLRPENKADAWEEEALRAFASGATEVSAVQELDGRLYQRVMRPFVTEKSCLKCHAKQGYREGDVRGGVSVSMPLRALQEATHGQVVGEAVAHGALWLLGVSMIGLGSRKLARSAAALQESEIRYRTVADFTSDWEYWLAPDGSLRYVSPSSVQVCGYSAEELCRDSDLMLRMIHPEDLSRYRGHFHLNDDTGSPIPIDFRIITRDGRERWISHVCREIVDADGRHLGRRASNRDITDRMRIEEALREQTAMLEDEMAERQSAQESLQEQAAMLEEEVAERQLAQEELALNQKELERLNHQLEERVETALTELRQKDQLLIQQSRLAGMGEMINNIAHQWRQPLNNVGLIIQNLQISHEAGTLRVEEMRSEVDKAMDIILHMSQTIDDFRNFFRQDKEQHTFVVNKVVKRIINFVKTSLESSDIRLELEESGPVSISGFQNEYAQALINVVGNARDALLERGVPDPCISIRVGCENGRSLVAVRDNAGGIDAAILPRVFDPYFTTKPPGKGTGIGLYMSKVIIEQHMGGTLSVRNVGGGAEFTLVV